MAWSQLRQKKKRAQTVSQTHETDGEKCIITNLLLTLMWPERIRCQSFHFSTLKVQLSMPLEAPLQRIYHRNGNMSALKTSLSVVWIIVFVKLRYLVEQPLVCIRKSVEREPLIQMDILALIQAPAHVPWAVHPGSLTGTCPEAPNWKRFALIVISWCLNLH